MSFRFIIILLFTISDLLVGTAQDITYGLNIYCGESISYRLKYGIFNIGHGSISCSTNLDKNLGHIVAEAQSSGWIKVFKNLNYRYESYLDLDTGLPRLAIRSLKDGRYDVYNELNFDHDTRIDSAMVFSQMSGQHVVAKNIFDILTGFYHFRMNFITDNMIEGEVVVIKTFFSDEEWDLKIRYSGIETIKTKYGNQKCYKYNPGTVIGKYFNNKDDMSIWFTNDKIPIPIKIKADLKFGSVILECTEYQNMEFFTSGISEKIGRAK